MNHPYLKSLTDEGKTYIAIGDIHGCHRELRHMLQVLSEDYDLKNPDTHLIFLGDYIDRGDSSIEVINTLLEIKREYPQSIFLMGNHEESFLEDEIRSFNDIPEPTPEYVTQFLKSMPLYYETPGFLFIHGGPTNAESDLQKETRHDLLWNYIPDSNGWRGRTVVKGHTTVRRPTQLGHVLYLDSGCCFGDTLSCAIIDGSSQEILEFKQVKRVHFLGQDRRRHQEIEEEPRLAAVVPLKSTANN